MTPLEAMTERMAAYEVTAERTFARRRVSSVWSGIGIPVVKGYDMVQTRRSDICASS